MNPQDPKCTPPSAPAQDYLSSDPSPDASPIKGSLYWRKSPPTKEELLAHSKAHEAEPGTANWARLVLIDGEIDLQNYALGPESAPCAIETHSHHVIAYRPLNLVGDPVPWPGYIKPVWSRDGRMHCPVCKADRGWRGGENCSCWNCGWTHNGSKRQDMLFVGLPKEGTQQP